MFSAGCLVKVILTSFVVPGSLTVHTSCILVMIRMASGISFTKLVLVAFRQGQLVMGLTAIHYGQALKTCLTNFLRPIFLFGLKPTSQLQTQAVLDITGVVTAFAWVTDSLRMEKSQFMMTVG